MYKIHVSSSTGENSYYATNSDDAISLLKAIYSWWHETDLEDDGYEFGAIILDSHCGGTYAIESNNVIITFGQV